MKMGGGTGLADVAHLVAANDTLSGVEDDAVGVEMAVKREELATVGKGVLYDDHALIASPSHWFGIGDEAMPDAVNGRAQISGTGRSAPIFSGMIFGVPVPINAKVNPTSAYAGSVGRIDGEVKCINHAAGKTAVRLRCF